MNVAAIWFGFHPRASLRECITSRRWMMFGHVEAWGATQNGIWFFYDPEAGATKMHLTTDENEVDERFGRRIEVCQSILLMKPPFPAITLPFHPMMNCVSQCAHLAGLRAYTPGRLHRMLRANGAVEVSNDPEGRPGSEEGP